ncbi:MAG TPA: hypothetical protein VH062_01725 [Polyangiaceae bacterium]|jgi:hypothetical protein|nr:hypothetical protein [Polyangiaceae bacterium]
MKFHALGGSPPEEPSGVLVYHNTFVSPVNALADHTSDTSHHFVLENNLFVSAPAASGRTLDWTSPIDDGTFDYDGYYPDGIFDYDFAGSGYQKVTSFAMARSLQPVFEPHGILLTTPIFASGLVPPATYETTLPAPDVALADGSNAIDHGVVLPGIDDGFTGAAPDLGALEHGCPAPLYGVRPAGMDEVNMLHSCTTPVDTDGGAAPSGGATSNGGTTSNAGATSNGGVHDGTAGARGVDAGPRSDLGDASDGATATSGAGSGCGCRTSPADAPPSRTLEMIAAAVALSCARRRPRSR